MAKLYKKLPSFPPKKSCNFCHTRILNEYQLGHVAELQGITVHYFCLLLSGQVKQRGKDQQGILGFLPVDIKKELYRGKKLFCEACGKNGATLRCAFHKCSAVFHLPCGLKRGSLSQFYGFFRSWCVKHRPTQTIHPKVRREATECAICLDDVGPDINLTIWPTCCKPPSTLLHRACVQRMAIVAGYYHYKCPLCNDKTKFIKETHRMGVYIPEQEAQWELEGEFEDLLHQRIFCDAGGNCRCARGIEYNRPNSQWKLEKCGECGLNATHLQCSGIWKAGMSFWIDWTCSTCLTVVCPNDQRLTMTGSTESQHGSELTDVLDMEANRESEEVDVETVWNPENYVKLENCMPGSPSRPETPECLRNRIVIINDSDDDVDDVVCISDDDEVKPSNLFPSVPITRSASLKEEEVIELD